MMPWIAEADQKVLFKDNVSFKTPEEQVGICRKSVHWIGDCVLSVLMQRRSIW
jgi:hypothetical protein